jgi:hypothetical protein
MVATINQNFINQFSDNLHHLVEQKGSNLRNIFPVEMAKGEKHFFDRLGNFTAGEVTGRLDPIVLQDPAHYRIDIAPAEYKAELTEIYRDHINWLRDKDPLNRASQGFESAVVFMNSTDNTHLIDTFWRKTHELDSIRKETCLTVIPELKALK